MTTRGPDRLLTLDEVAARLGVSLRSVQQSAKLGHLRTVSVTPGGRKRRVTEAELAAFIASRTRRGAA